MILYIVLSLILFIFPFSSALSFVKVKKIKRILQILSSVGLFAFLLTLFIANVNISLSDILQGKVFFLSSVVFG